MPRSMEDLRRRIAAQLRDKQSATIPAEFRAHLKAAAAESDGWVWPVVVCKSGWGTAELTGVEGMEGKPQFIRQEVLPQIAEAVNGVRFRRRHPLEHEGNGEGLPELVAGWVENARVVGDEVHADVHLLPTETEIRARLVAARDAGQMELFNVSLLCAFHGRVEKIEGREAVVVNRIHRVVALDMCAEPGWGGKFLPTMRLAASLGAIEEEVGTSASADADRERKGARMKDHILKLLVVLASFAKERADELRKGLDTAPEAELPKRFDQVVDAFIECSNGAFVAANASKAQDPALIERVRQALGDLAKMLKDTGAGAEMLAKAAAAQSQADASLAEAKKIQFSNLLDSKLKEAKLPEQAEGIVRAHFKDRVVDDKAIDAEITTVKAAFAAFTEIGRVSDAHPVIVGRETQDKLQLAMDATFGVKAALDDKNVRPFRGIREAYVEITGDRELTFRQGGLYRVRAAITTASLPDILLNSMTKRLIQDYMAIGWNGVDKIVRFVGVNDYKTQHRVRLGYFPDLATVNEAGAYTEIANPTDDLIQYAVTKKGHIFTLTEETIRNDDLGKLRSLPERLARAAIRTAKQAVTTLLTTPGNYDADGVAIFHASHGNLGSAALSAGELDAREIALYNQAEPDTSKPLGLTLDWIMVPIGLKSTALQINNNNEGSNPWFKRFGQNGENIIVNELLAAADANDWYGGTFMAPFIEMGVLDGADGQPPVPQILLANDPVVGAQFTNDQAVYKVKSVFGLDYLDFRSAFKNVVP